MLKVLTWVLKQTSVIKPKDFGNQHAIKLNKEEKSLAHLAQKALEDNKGKPSLLPLKTDDKLTVVFELDEVLAFTFVPNEEGYLNSPRRKSDFHCWFS